MRTHSHPRSVDSKFRKSCRKNKRIQKMRHMAILVFVVAVVSAAEEAEMKRPRRGFFRYREPKYHFRDQEHQYRDYHQYPPSNFGGNSDLSNFGHDDFRMGERPSSYSFNNHHPLASLAPSKVSTVSHATYMPNTLSSTRPFSPTYGDFRMSATIGTGERPSSLSFNNHHPLASLTPLKDSTVSPATYMPNTFSSTQPPSPTNADFRMSATIGPGPITMSTEAPLRAGENKFNDPPIISSTAAPSMSLSTVTPRLTLGHGSNMFTNDMAPATELPLLSSVHKQETPVNSVIPFDPVMNKIPISIPDVTYDVAEKMKMMNVHQITPNNVIYDSGSPSFADIKQTLPAISFPSLAAISEPAREIRYAQPSLHQLTLTLPVPAAPALALGTNSGEIPVHIIQGGQVPSLNFDQGFRHFGYAAPSSGLSLNLGGYGGIDYSGIHAGSAVRPLTLGVSNVGLNVPAIQAAPAAPFTKTWIWP